MKKQIWIIGLLWFGAVLPAFAGQPMVGMEMQEKNRAGQPSKHWQGGVRGSCKISYQTGARADQIARLVSHDDGFPRSERFAAG